MENINIAKSIVNKNVSSYSLFCSEEHADAYFLFRCDGDGDETTTTSSKCETDNRVLQVKGAENETADLRTKKIAVHKLILAAGSPVFHQMFYGQLQETEPVKIVDVSINAFIEFLQFFYSAEPILTWENAGEVIYCGLKYLVPHVVDAYKHFLQNDVLNYSNVFSILGIAIRHEFPELIKQCEKVITDYSCSGFDDIDFVRCDRVTLKHVLSIENLDCSEHNLFIGCMKWALEHHKLSVEQKKFTSKNSKQWLGSCWNLIRFPIMTIEEFTAVTTNYRNYFENDEIADILGYIVNKTPMSNAIYETLPRKGADDNKNDSDESEYGIE